MLEVKGSPMSRRVVLLRCALLSTVALISSSCSTIEQLKHLGETPKLSPVSNPISEPGYKPVQMPMPKPEVASYNATSLWRNGSRAFFRDQRAARVGDLLTVTVNITDKANLSNETQRLAFRDSERYAVHGLDHAFFREEVRLEVLDFQ